MDPAKALTPLPTISPPSSDQTLTLDPPISPLNKPSSEQTLTLDPPIAPQKAPSSEQTLTLHPPISPQNTPYSEKALTLGHDHPLQKVIVMRHGHRLDALKRSWKQTAQRPWDPPITVAGTLATFCSGVILSKQGFQIHRVLVSPFLRCIQTAIGVIAALCASEMGLHEFMTKITSSEIHPSEVEERLAEFTSKNVVFDPTKIKVSIEYGLCEALCGPSIKPEVIPKDGNWFPDVSELEALLPQGIVDRSVECVYPELPQWEEEQKVSCRRLKRVIRSLADKFPKENLLLIAHVAGVAVGMRAFSKRPVIVDKVGYCSYACLQRSASSPSDLEALTKKSRGVTYCIEGERSPKSQGSLTK
ncbi:hypothetical protein AMTRI_Chr13g115470 [Amborella trichopoda]